MPSQGVVATRVPNAISMSAMKRRHAIEPIARYFYCGCRTDKSEAVSRFARSPAFAGIKILQRTSTKAARMTDFFAPGTIHDNQPRRGFPAYLQSTLIRFRPAITNREASLSSLHGPE